MPAASAPMPRNIVCRRENDPAAGRMHFAKSKGRPIRGGLQLVKKPRRVRSPQAANRVQFIFRGGMYVAKNSFYIPIR